MMTLGVVTVSAQQTDVRPGKFSVHLGYPLPVFGGKSFIGKENAGLSIGLLTTPRNLFMLGLNFGDGPSKQIGTYSYYVYDPIHLTETVRNDGKVLYKYAYMDVMFSYSRLFDLSKMWQFCAGPAVGLTQIYAQDSYEDSFEGWVEGLPSHGDRITKNAFTAGVLTGFRLNFFGRGSLDITYLLAGHGKINFEEREISVLDKSVEIDRKAFGNMSHRFNISVGWRFGKDKNKY